MSAPWLRTPAVLMTAYVGLFLYAGPSVGTGSGSHRDVIVAILLAVFASRGSRVARVLMITYSVIGVLVMLIGSTSWWSTQAPALRFEYFVCYLIQICLLVSTPMYERTRPGWSPHRFPPTQFLPAPRIWMVLASTTIGLIITLLPLAGLRPVACPDSQLAAHALPCLAQGTGYPIAYRFDGGILRLRAGSVQWLNVPAPRGTQALALAADWAMWSLGILLVFYLAWLTMDRGYAAAERRSVASSTASTSP